MSMRKSARSTRSTLQTERGKNYKLFAFNYHGKTLAAIRDEFYKQVNTGLRRRVFIIDLEQEMHKRQVTNERASKLSRESKLARESRMKKDHHMDLISVTHELIEKCRREYDEITHKITKEKSFNLLHYWEADVNQHHDVDADNFGKRKNSMNRVSLEKVPEKRKTSRGDKGSMLPALQESQMALLANCPKLVAKQHSRTGQPELLSKRKYIEDEPPNSKIYIIIMGQLNQKFYLDLLSRGEPLQAILHFLPELSAYDYLLPHSETQTFIIESMEHIQAGNYELRKHTPTKSVGMFQQGLPVISRCMAEKYARDIFDQLCWCVYDVELLHQQYLEYYVHPFKETNVSMPESVSMQTLLDVAESLSVQGHYLKTAVPAFREDAATILLYLDGLLSTIGEPAGVLRDHEMSMFARPLSRATYDQHGHMVQAWSERFTDAFKSITKLRKIGRLFVEHGNALLYTLVTYARHEDFCTIYRCCLEYQLLRTYIVTAHVKNTVPYHAYDCDTEPLYLPGLVQLHSTDDSVLQRLTQLFADYDDYVVDEIYPGCKLYHFKRVYNEIFEYSKLMVLPTRLCFRDFTLFQMEEFLRDLITVEQRRALNEAHLTDEDRKNLEFKQKHIDVNPHIFIRTKSLKARKLHERVTTTASETRIRPSAGSRKLKMTESKSYVSVAAKDDYVGLYPNHPLLKGYNLEDIRQEILVKRSKYHFEEGLIQYYEERWCFDDMNKLLELTINDSRLSLSCPRRQLSHTLNNIRLETLNGVSIRIYGETTECAKIVLNYPNGLSVYYHENYTEQIWSQPETYNQERRRLCTCHGAVIVHFKEEEMILVMRYNGEVYKLYQYEFTLGEEEGQGTEMTAESTGDTFDDATTELTLRLSNKLRASTKSSKSAKVLEPSTEAATTGKTGRLSKKRKSSQATAARLPSQQSELSQSVPSEPVKPLKDLILESVVDELRFLQFICAKYELSYMHLILITSTGRVINMTHRGKVFEAHTMWNVEWHDYFANESYAMRQDGVKMIWQQEALKCFHADGTIITSKVEEGYEGADFDEELDPLITSSSSHEHFHDGGELYKNSEDNSPKTDSIFVIPSHASSLKHGRLQPSLPPLVPPPAPPTPPAPPAASPPLSQHHLHPEKTFATEASMEVEAEEDHGYVSYTYESSFMQHKHYASVYILLLKNFINDVSVFMEIYGADDTRVQVTTAESYESELINTMGAQTDETIKSFTMSHISFKEQPGIQHVKPRDDLYDARTEELQSVVKVWIGDRLDVAVTEKDCSINAILDRCDVERGKVRENLQLKFDFEENLTDLFAEFISKISEFKNYKGCKRDDLYFMEKVDDKCRMQGFEFFDELPPQKGYTYVVSNTITELRELQTMDEKLANKYDWYTRDMKKFPRFQKRSKVKPTPIDTFPMVLSAIVYVKVPRLLTNTEDIPKFMEPFEGITFKKTRKQIIGALDFYLRPWIRIKLLKWSSKISWRRRHEQHSLRLFQQQQRAGLYHAMLRHKVYPSYEQFTQEFHSKVKYIDFFSFMTANCQDGGKYGRKLSGKLSQKFSIIMPAESKHSQHFQLSQNSHHSQHSQNSQNPQDSQNSLNFQYSQPSQHSQHSLHSQHSQHSLHIME